MSSAAFKRKVKTILQAYEGTALQKRWAEAISFGAADQAKAFWIRDSEDVVNIVWLNDDGIRDITLLPKSGETMFNLLLLKNITTFEIREGEQIPTELRLGVKGHLVVHVVVSASYGQIYWVANTKKEVRELDVFLKAVMHEYLHSH